MAFLAGAQSSGCGSLLPSDPQNNPVRQVNLRVNEHEWEPEVASSPSPIFSLLPLWFSEGMCVTFRNAVYVDSLPFPTQGRSCLLVDILGDTDTWETLSARILEQGHVFLLKMCLTSQLLSSFF